MILTRITCEYVSFEDRVRVAGEAEGGDIVVFWLTRRLLDRMVVHLCRWIDSRVGDGLDGHREILHGFAQQSARSSLQRQEPVQVGQENGQWLVHSVDVTEGEGGVRLVFKAPRVFSATITLPMSFLRQWLCIIRNLYCKGGWALDVWPEWARDERIADEAWSVRQ